MEEAAVGNTVGALEKDGDSVGTKDGLQLNRQLWSICRSPVGLVGEPIK